MYKDEKSHEGGEKPQHIKKKQTEDWQRNLKQNIKSPILPCYASASSQESGVMMGSQNYVRSQNANLGARSLADMCW